MGDIVELRARVTPEAAAKPVIPGLSNVELAQPIETTSQNVEGFPRRLWACNCGGVAHKLLDTGKVQCAQCLTFQHGLAWGHEAWKR